MIDLLLRAKELADKEPDEALSICNKVMNEEFDSPEGQMALFMSGYIFMQAERFGLAYHAFQRCAQLRPDKSEIYANMGMCLEQEKPYLALDCFEHAIELEPENAKAYANAGLIYLQTNRPEKCVEYCDKALELDPDLISAKHNKGLALVMLRQFKEGWKLYSDTLGVKHREIRDYGLPEWDGISEGKVLVYGEQGVGDEIMFASMLNDIPNDIVLDCDSRLQSLFEHSFDFPIYGTRYKSSSPIIANHPDLKWQCAAGQLCSFYRNTEESFPKTPYLKPDPEKVVMWKALFDTYKGRKIGLAWSGGLLSTGEKKRSFNLSDLEPIINDKDTFISLQYKNTGESHGSVKTFMEYTGAGRDIDHLAAMIANLDLVITCCTTVVYIAGALGVPCYVLVPDEPSYRYHKKGDFPWYESVKIHRQRKGEKWVNCIKRLKIGRENAENIRRLRYA